MSEFQKALWRFVGFICFSLGIVGSMITACIYFWEKSHINPDHVNGWLMSLFCLNILMILSFAYIAFCLLTDLYDDVLWESKSSA